MDDFVDTAGRYVADEEFDDIHNPSWAHIRSGWQDLTHEKIDELWQQKRHWTDLDLFADFSVIAGQATYTGGHPGDEDPPRGQPAPSGVLGSGRTVDSVITDAITSRVNHIAALRMQMHRLCKGRPRYGVHPRVRQEKLRGLMSSIASVDKQIRSLEDARMRRQQNRALILDEYRRLVDFYGGVATSRSEFAFMNEVERTNQQVAFYNTHYGADVWYGKSSAKVDKYTSL